MSKILVIVESPAKCAKIESFLGSSYKCIASYGHFRELKGLEQIDRTNGYKPSYTLMEDSLKQKQIEKIRNEIEKAQEVILATDDDREGEAIAWHLCDYYGLSLKTTKRIVFHEITETAIQQAIQQPRLIHLNVVKAQQGRQILDLLVGFTVSPILWKCISKNHENSLSAGRCQSPALRLVYDNYKEINDSSLQYVYKVEGIFTNQNISFEYSKTWEKEEEVIDFLQQSSKWDHVYSVSNPKMSILSPPEPLITSTLQQLASNELHFSPKETMKYAQELYENGLITYMRTDNKMYSNEFTIQAKKYITETYNDTKYIHSQMEKLVMANHQEAHEAIRVVSLFVRTEDISPEISSKSKKIYELIWKRSLQSCMSAATSQYIVAEITAYQGVYKHRADQMLFHGWKVLENTCKTNTNTNSNNNTNNNTNYSYLLSLKKGNLLHYKKIFASISCKQSILHYTEARLVQLLEEKGIGRPSTFSTLIDKIQQRGYVTKKDISGKKISCKEFLLEGEEEVITEQMIEKEFGKEKNKLVMTSLGVLVMEFLITHFDSFFHYEYTRTMEDALDNISKGETAYYDLCETCHQDLQKLIQGLKLQKTEFRIDDHHSYIIGKRGPVIKKTINETVSFLSVKKEIDMNRLEAGQYTLEDLLEDTTTCIPIGKYEGQDLYIKKGKFGDYAQWGSNRQSINAIKHKSMDYLEVIKFLDKHKLVDPTKSLPSGIVREVSRNITIRSGKFGDYLFYKTSKMTKPQFLKLNGCKDYKTCPLSTLQEWIKKEHNIQ